MTHLSNGVGMAFAAQDLEHSAGWIAEAPSESGQGLDASIRDGGALALCTLLVDRVVTMLVGPAAAGPEVLALIRSLLDCGICPEEVVGGLLVAVARRLGELWLADECSFVDVTIAMQQLGAGLIEIEAAAPSPPLPAAGRCILLSPVPGDQHGFGLSVLGFFLRRAGWEVAAPVLSSAGRIVAEVEGRHYDAIGLSIGHERALTSTAALIRQLRTRSANPAIAVAVGGPTINERPEQATAIGADLWAPDAATFVKELGRNDLYTPTNAD